MAYITPEQARQRFIPKHKAGQAAPFHQVIRFDRTIGDKGLLYIIKNETTGMSYLSPADDALAHNLGEWESIENIEDMPENMRDWFSCYEAEIEWWQEEGNSSVVGAANNSSDTVTDDTQGTIIDMEVTWDQLVGVPRLPTIDEIYTNKLTYGPFVGNSPFYFNGNLYTNIRRRHWLFSGCPATALSQVLYYWCKKKGYYIGCRDIPGYTCAWSRGTVNNDLDYPVLGGNGSGEKLNCKSSFDFDNMYDSYPDSSSYNSYNEQEKEALSTFIQYTATALKSYPSYKKATVTASDGTKTIHRSYTSATAADPIDILAGIKDKFILDAVGYTTVITSGFIHKSWEDIVAMIKTEIEENGNPVLIDGVSSGEGGHIFICDGYAEVDNTIKLHINWGWGGAGDGWFPYTALNYDATHKYNSKRKAYFNVKPRYSKDNVNHLLLLKILRNVGVTNTSKTKELYRELNFDYDDTITDGDAETLAKFMLRDKDITKAEDHKSIELSALVDIRKSLRKINDKLSQLSS